jgi:hypothetical protein
MSGSESRKKHGLEMVVGSQQIQQCRKTAKRSEMNNWMRQMSNCSDKWRSPLIRQIIPQVLIWENLNFELQCYHLRSLDGLMPLILVLPFRVDCERNFLETCHESLTSCRSCNREQMTKESSPRLDRMLTLSDTYLDFGHKRIWYKYMHEKSVGG